MQKAKDETEALGKSLAIKYKDADGFYLIATGPLAGLTYQFATCNLLEMQWKHAGVWNAAEFKHGPLEIVEEGLPMIFLLGTDETRPVAERARDFAVRHGADVISFDLADLEDFILVGSFWAASASSVDDFLYGCGTTTPDFNPPLYGYCGVLMRIAAVGDNCVDIYTNKGWAFPGGGSVNFAAHASRQGAAMSYVGVIGTDFWGDMLQNALHAEGIDTTYLIREDGPTAVAYVHLDGTERTFIGSEHGVREILEDKIKQKEILISLPVLIYSHDS